MAKSPKSYLLEQLRAQAEPVNANRVRAQELLRTVVARVDRNADRFEPVILDFEPAAPDTPVLDELVNLLSGKSSQFLLRAPLRGFGR